MCTDRRALFDQQDVSLRAGCAGEVGEMNAGSQPRRAAADDQNVYMDDFALHRALAPPPPS
jgi:hypothetical protein